MSVGSVRDGGAVAAHACSWVCCLLHGQQCQSQRSCPIGIARLKQECSGEHDSGRTVHSVRTRNRGGPCMPCGPPGRTPHAHASLQQKKATLKPGLMAYDTYSVSEVQNSHHHTPSMHADRIMSGPHFSPVDELRTLRPDLDLHTGGMVQQALRLRLRDALGVAAVRLHVQQHRRHLRHGVHVSSHQATRAVVSDGDLPQVAIVLWVASETV